ncbi:hypothetical protein D3C73_1037980 [compost metagenome]
MTGYTKDQRQTCIDVIQCRVDGDLPGSCSPVLIKLQRTVGDRRTTTVGVPHSQNRGACSDLADRATT